MRVRVALAILIATTMTALAGGPVIVIPGRPGVPIIINGRDASYAVVEGDWGLAHGVHVQPTVYGGTYVDPAPRVGHYYPSAGRQPGYGRVEIEPPADRRLPPQAENFQRSWSAQSTPSAQAEVPLNPPLIIEGPQTGAASAPQDFRRGGRRNFRN